MAEASSGGSQAQAIRDYYANSTPAGGRSTPSASR